MSAKLWERRKSGDPQPAATLITRIEGFAHHRGRAWSERDIVLWETIGNRCWSATECSTRVVASAPWLAVLRLKVGPRRMLEVLLAAAASGAMGVWMTRAEWAAVLGVSPRTVTNYRRTLKEAGLTCEHAGYSQLPIGSSDDAVIIRVTAACDPFVSAANEWRTKTEQARKDAKRCREQGKREILSRARALSCPGYGMRYIGISARGPSTRDSRRGFILRAQSGRRRTSSEKPSTTEACSSACSTDSAAASERTSAPSPSPSEPRPSTPPPRTTERPAPPRPSTPPRRPPPRPRTTERPAPPPEASTSLESSSRAIPTGNASSGSGGSSGRDAHPSPPPSPGGGGGATGGGDRMAGGGASQGTVAAAGLGAGMVRCPAPSSGPSGQNLPSPPLPSGGVVPPPTGRHGRGILSSATPQRDDGSISRLRAAAERRSEAQLGGSILAAAQAAAFTLTSHELTIIQRLQSSD